MTTVSSGRQCDRCGADYAMGSGLCECGRLYEDQLAERGPTAAELLALQESLSRAYLRRMDVSNGYLTWPKDALADELDELASDIAFERHGWLAPVPSS